MMTKSAINPQSPIPLYHQIAESIRARIEAGELAAGDVLEPLREAARTWGVNLHTVRHAYTALAREGLVVSRGAGGTRVTADAPRSSGVDMGEFLRRVVHQAEADFGLAPDALSSEIARFSTEKGDSRPEVYFVECSVGQCQAHAREIRGEFDVDAEEWSLERGEEPPPGLIVATYFHYNDIRRLWPQRLREVRFVTIVPDREILNRLPEAVTRILVCDRDGATAETVAADFSLILEPQGYAVETLVSDDPASDAQRAGSSTVILAAPRVWSVLTDEARSHARIQPASYLIDAHELAALGRDEGWRKARFHEKNVE